jgi:hypothetical protein
MLLRLLSILYCIRHIKTVLDMSLFSILLMESVWSKSETTKEEEEKYVRHVP